jgi:hypothetical protein
MEQFKKSASLEHKINISFQSGRLEQQARRFLKVIRT